jgi:hypothetical protein
MHLVNILRIFVVSLVLGHSNFNNTLFQWFFGVFGTPCSLRAVKQKTFYLWDMYEQLSEIPCTVQAALNHFN